VQLKNQGMPFIGVNQYKKDRQQNKKYQCEQREAVNRINSSKNLHSARNASF
jgi:hypothetical protein